MTDEQQTTESQDQAPADSELVAQIAELEARQADLLAQSERELQAIAQMGIPFDPSMIFLSNRLNVFINYVLARVSPTPERCTMFTLGFEVEYLETVIGQLREAKGELRKVQLTAGIGQPPPPPPNGHRGQRKQGRGPIPGGF